MKRNKVIFGMVVAGSLVLIFMTGLWFGGISKVEAQCRSLWLASCSGNGCVASCAPGFNFTNQVRTDYENLNFVAICAQ